MNWIESVTLTLIFFFTFTVFLYTVDPSDIQKAEAEHENDFTTIWASSFRVLEHILEEEKKQTALLDHIDCIQ